MPASTDPSPTPQHAAEPAWRRWLPRTLFARVTLIIVVGLAFAQMLAFASIQYERGLALRALMMTGVELDIASSVAILNRLPATERAAWLERLERPNYRFALGGHVEGTPPQAGPLREFTDAIVLALRPFKVTQLAYVASARETVMLQVRLDDGSDLYVRARRVPMPVSGWVVWALLLQLAVLAVCAWLAVRLVTRPLAELAAAAEQLGPDLRRVTLHDGGPTEVARASQAFNAMQRRIAGYMDERVEILAAISHDLQTPITRMRLRIDLMEGHGERDKLRHDLDAMQHLVREGLTYARSLHGEAEASRRLDVGALLESLVADYQDTGQDVRFEGAAGAPLATRPQALRRILTNLIDNALKFGGDALVRVEVSHLQLSIAVVDHGPGIPPEQLDAVPKPFYRVENSRNRGTGGTGLGLAIAHQLAMAMGAQLSLHNRPEGGLKARLVLPLS